MRCSFCGQPAVYHEVTLWEAQGAVFGMPRTLDKHATGRGLCGECAFDIRNGQPPATPKLFRP